MKLVICGRATSASPEVNVRDVAAAAARDDFKVMGSRVDGDLSFTVALAFIGRHVASLARYFALKEQIVAYLATRLPPCASTPWTTCTRAARTACTSR